MFGSGVNWIYTSVTVSGSMVWPVAELLFVGFIALLSLMPAIAGWVYSRFFSLPSPLITLLVFPALWVLTEWGRMWPFSGLPWLYVGGGHISTLLKGWIPLLGVFGASYWVAFTAAGLFLALRHRATKWLFVAILPWFLGAALLRIDWVSPVDESLAVALVQSNTPRDIKWGEGTYDSILNSLEAMTREVEGVDLVLWSESAVAKPYPEAKDWLDQQRQRARDKGYTLATGILDQRFEVGRWRTFNSVVFLGDEITFYDKRHLVPFGEFVPLESWLRGRIPYFDLPNSRSSPGDPKQNTNRVNGWDIAALVCYEVAFANTLYKDGSRADLFLVVSNGNWFNDSIEIWQQYEMARLRALENGRPLVQASNDGVTVIVDHKGQVVAEAKPYTKVVLSGEVHKVEGRTPFSYWGNHLMTVLCALLVIGFGIQHRHSQQNTYRDSTSA